MKTDVEILLSRLKRIGIDLELVGNIPWIYLHKVNGVAVRREDFSSEYGYVVAWYPVMIGRVVHLDSDIKRTFRVIRKYAYLKK
jgi:hypothetical protein